MDFAEWYRCFLAALTGTAMSVDHNAMTRDPFQGLVDDADQLANLAVQRIEERYKQRQPPLPTPAPIGTVYAIPDAEPEPPPPPPQPKASLGSMMLTDVQLEEIAERSYSARDDIVSIIQDRRLLLLDVVELRRRVTALREELKKRLESVPTDDSIRRLLWETAL